MSKVFGGSWLERRSKAVRDARIKKQSEKLIDQDFGVRKAAANKIWRSLTESPETTLATWDNLYAMIGVLNIDLVGNLQHRQIYAKAISVNSGLRVEFLASHSQALTAKRDELKDYDSENAEYDGGEYIDVATAIEKGKEVTQAFLDTTDAYILYQELLKKPKIAAKFTADELLALALKNHGAASAIFFQDEKPINDNELGVKVASIITEGDIAAFLNKNPEEQDPHWENYFPTTLCFFLKNCPNQFERFCENPSAFENGQAAYDRMCAVMFENIIEPTHTSYRPDVVEQIKTYPALLLLLAKHQDPNQFLDRFTSLIIHATKPSNFIKKALSSPNAQELKDFVFHHAHAFAENFKIKLALKINAKAISKTTAADQLDKILAQVCLLDGHDLSSIISLIMQSSNPARLLAKVIAQDNNGVVANLINQNVISFVCDFKAELKKNVHHDKVKREGFLDELFNIKLNNGQTISRLFKSTINTQVLDFSQLPCSTASDFPEIDAKLREIIPIFEDGYFSKKISLTGALKREWLSKIQFYTRELVGHIAQNQANTDTSKLLFLAKTPTSLTKLSVVGGIGHVAKNEASTDDSSLVIRLDETPTSLPEKSFFDDLASLKKDISNIELANRYFHCSEIINSADFRKNFYKTYVRDRSLTFEMASLIRRDPKLFSQFKSEQSVWGKIKAFFGFSTHNQKSVALIKQIVKQSQADISALRRECKDIKDDQWLKTADAIRDDLRALRTRANNFDDANLKKKIREQRKAIKAFKAALKSDPASMSELSALHQHKALCETALNKLNDMSDQRDQIETLILKYECKNINKNKQLLSDILTRLVTLQKIAQEFEDVPLNENISTQLAVIKDAQAKLAINYEVMSDLSILRQYKARCETALSSVNSKAAQRDQIEIDVLDVLKHECEKIKKNKQRCVNFIKDLHKLEESAKEFKDEPLNESISKQLEAIKAVQAQLESEHANISDLSELHQFKEQCEIALDSMEGMDAKIDQIEMMVLRLQCAKFKKQDCLSTTSLKHLVETVANISLNIDTLSRYKESACNLEDAKSRKARLERDVVDFIANIEKDCSIMTLNELRGHKNYCTFAKDSYKAIDDKLVPLHREMKQFLSEALHASQSPEVSPIRSFSGGYSYSTQGPVSSAPPTPGFDHDGPQSSLPPTPTTQHVESVVASPNSQISDGARTPAPSAPGTPLVEVDGPQSSLPGTPTQFDDVGPKSSLPASSSTPVQVGTPSSSTTTTPVTPYHPPRKRNLLLKLVATPDKSPVSSEPAATPIKSVGKHRLFSSTPGQSPVCSEPSSPVCSEPAATPDKNMDKHSLFSATPGQSPVSSEPSSPVCSEPAVTPDKNMDKHSLFSATPGQSPVSSKFSSPVSCESATSDKSMGKYSIFSTTPDKLLVNSEPTSPVCSESATPDKSAGKHRLFPATPDKSPVSSAPSSPVCSQPTTPEPMTR